VTTPSPLSNVPEEQGSAPAPPVLAAAGLRDWLGGALMTAVAVAFAIASTQTPFTSQFWVWYTSPTIFALGMAICLGACGIGILARGWRVWRRHRGSLPEGWSREALRAWGLDRFVRGAGFIVVYLVLLGRLPFLLAAALLILTVGLTFRDGPVLPVLRAAGISAVVVVVILAAFSRIFGILLP